MLVAGAALWVAIDRLRGGGHAAAEGTVASTPSSGSSALSDSGPTPAGGCAKLTVVTASSFAPVLREVATTLTHGPNCVTVHTTVADGQDASKVVATSKADAWIPDDSSWLNLPVAAKLAPGPSPVLATSPLYFVTPKGTGLPKGATSWLGMADTLGKRGRLRLVLSDPAASGAALVAAGALTDAGIAAQGPLVSALNLMRTWQAGRTVDGVAPAFPTKSDQVGIVPEYALLGGAAKRYTVTAPGGSQTPYLRYVWLPTVSGAAAHSAGLGTLETALSSTAAQRVLAKNHLRGANRTPIPADTGVAASLPTPAGQPMGVIAEHYLYHVLTTYHPSRRKANILVVIDVSGSMNDLAPNSDSSLITLARNGVGQLTSLMPSTSHIGLWQFGSQLDGDLDYQSLVTDKRLTTSQRNAIGAAAQDLRARSTGTGLYQTILAAYRQQQKHFQPGMPNEVLVFTDGVDGDDPGSITLPELYSGLAATDPAKPVQIGVLGFGDELPVNDLTYALSPVNGQVDVLTHTDEVIGAFVHAVSGSLTH
jgi:hypothetical protein